MNTPSVAEPPHQFHIPVMGTGFTIDTPLKVARFGISSVISLVDDVLIEQMRKFHSLRTGEPYTEITDRDEDRRARRITAYLDLLQRLLDRQVAELQALPFETGSELDRYFELLPEGARKTLYREMQATSDPKEKARLQDQLRTLATPGTIDVNIMTKLDRDAYRGVEKQPAMQSDALSALRGFANSTLKSSMVFSAGMNLRLYSYAAQFADFLPDAAGWLKKKIVLKVSDFRSAAIQGKVLAKRGLWISEYRIESGLNCGGHAFATEGHLLGPILEEFRQERDTLTQDLFGVCNAALLAKGLPTFQTKPAHRVTVQGGIGTAEEQAFLLKTYRVDGTGWGTPFLLVPEAVSIDDDHLRRLSEATEKDVCLSDHSPLGVPFWTLVTSSSEKERELRIDAGHPGSDCPKRYLALNTEFTPVPICPASKAYQRLKLHQIEASPLPEQERQDAREAVLHKTCICHDLAGGAVISNGILPAAATAVCPGPNIVNFKKVATLKEMVDHIYGRLSLLARPERSHMFINELRLYVDHLKEECRKASEDCTTQAKEHLDAFKANLLTGTQHYQQMATLLDKQRGKFLEDLQRLREEIEAIRIPSGALTHANAG